MSEEAETEIVEVEAPEEAGVEEQRKFYSESYRYLQDIPGIGSATVTKLAELGYKTVKSVAVADEKDLISQGIGEETAKKLVMESRKTISLGFITAAEYKKIKGEYEYLTTGIKALDLILKPPTSPVGGIETKGITSFYGEFGSGKSQIAHQLCVTVQLPKSKGGLNANAMYIDTEQVFRPERVVTIAENLGFEDPEKVLENIIYAEAYTSNHQIELLNSADHTIEEENVRLIILDSGTGQFRAEYIGREMLAPRQQLINKHFNKLMRLARAFDCAAVITNQAVDTPDAWSSKDPKGIGGHIVGHIVHSHVYLRKGRDNLRIAKVTASPSLPIGEAPFLITENGLVDTITE